MRRLRKHELIEALRKNDDEVYFRVLRDDNDNDDDDVEYAENNHPNHASNNDVGYDNASDDGDYSDNDDDDDYYDDAEDAVAGGDDLGEDHQEQGRYITDGAGGDRPARDSPLSYTVGRRNSREIELQIQLERERRETMRLKWDIER